MEAPGRQWDTRDWTDADSATSISPLCCVLGPDRTQLSILMYSARCVYFSFRWPWGPPASSSWWETDSSTSLTVSRLEMKERKEAK